MKQNVNLDEIFEAMRQKQPMISQDSVRNFVENHVYQQNQRPVMYRVQRHRYSIAVATFGVCMVIFTSIFLTKYQPSTEMPLAGTPQQTQENSSQAFQSKKTPSNSTATQTIQNSSEQTTVQTSEPSAQQPPINAIPVNWVPDRIDPIKPYKLSRAELLKLGIYIDAEGQILIWNDKWGRVSFSRSKDSRTKTSGSFNIDAPATKPPIIIYSNLITDCNGRKKAIGHATASTLNLFDVPSIQNIIPIEVSVSPSTADLADTDCTSYIFWYEGTDEFIALLPTEVQRDIRSRGELKLWKGRQNANSSQQLLFVNIQMPKNNKTAKVNYSSTDAGKVAFTLYTIRGEKLDSKITDNPGSNSQRTVDVSLDTLDAGMYLLAVNTDRGESIVQRVVIQ